MYLYHNVANRQYKIQKNIYIKARERDNNVPDLGNNPQLNGHCS